MLLGLRESKKYRFASEDVLARVAYWAASRRRSYKGASKGAKRKLHQIYGAFFDGLDFSQLENTLAAIPQPATVDELKEVCQTILRGHASTAERLPYIAEFYRNVFERTGVPFSVLDIGCGLNPFSLPWMGLNEGSTYVAIDLDTRLTGCIDQFFRATGQLGQAICADVFRAVPAMRFDMALLMKLLPTLEQQETGASLSLLTQLNARYGVTTFPVRTLGGREVGMAAHYDRFMSELILAAGVEFERIDMGTEAVYILHLDS